MAWIPIWRDARGGLEFISEGLDIFAFYAFCGIFVLLHVVFYFRVRHARIYERMKLNMARKELEEHMSKKRSTLGRTLPPKAPRPFSFWEACSGSAGAYDSKSIVFENGCSEQ